MSRLRVPWRRSTSAPNAVGDSASGSAVAGAITLTGAEVVSAVLLALTSLYLVRTLSTHEYGRSAFGLSLHQLFFTLVSLGLTASVMAEIARSLRHEARTREPVHALLWLRVASVVPLVMLGSAWALASGDAIPVIASVAASTYLLQDFLVGMLAASRRTLACALVVVFHPIAYMAVLIALQIRTAEGVLAALAAALAGALLLGVSLLRRGTMDWIGWPAAWLGHLRRALAVAGYAYVLVIVQISANVLPIVILGVLGRFAEAASLSIVLTLVRFVPEALGFAVITIYFPRVAALDLWDDEGPVLFGSLARLLGWLAVPAAAGLAVIGGPLLAVLFSGRYDDLAGYLLLASVLVVLLAAESLLSWTLLGRGDGRDAVLGVGLRLVTVLLACGVIVVTPAGTSALVVLVAMCVGLGLSLAFQGLRVRRRRALAWPAASSVLYALVALLTYSVIRVALSGRVPDLGIVLVAAVSTGPVLAFGAWILRRNGSVAISAR